MTVINITETTLTDGSKVYGVRCGDTDFDCETEQAAYDLANAIDRHSIGHQFDGWAVIKLAA